MAPDKSAIVSSLNPCECGSGMSGELIVYSLESHTTYTEISNWTSYRIELVDWAGYLIICCTKNHFYAP